MSRTDSQVMAGRYELVPTPRLKEMIREAEADQDSGTEAGFSTALTDEDRYYLDLQAELFCRQSISGRQPCSEVDG